jgi:hypothetical protein
VVRDGDVIDPADGADREYSSAAPGKPKSPKRTPDNIMKPVNEFRAELVAKNVRLIRGG